MLLLGIAVGTASNTLAKFVAEHPHTDFEVHKADLQQVEAVQTPTLVVDEPWKRNSHVRKLTFSSMPKLINAERSMIPMCTFELAMGPRTIATHAEGTANARFTVHTHTIEAVQC